MESHLTKLSLALLSTVFLLGCQEQGSGPVGPEGLGPEFHHGKGGHAGGGGDNLGSPFYEYTFLTGAITTDPLTAAAVGGRSGDVGLQGCCGLSKDETLTLTSPLIDPILVDGALECFGATFPLDDFIGVLIPDKKDMNEVEARFLFNANDKDGNPGVRYKLTLTGTATGGGVFPPEPGTSMTVTYDDTFNINAQRKKEKNACSSGGFIPLGSGNEISVKLDGTDTDPSPSI